VQVRIPPLCGGDPSLGLDTTFGLLDHQLRVTQYIQDWMLPNREGDVLTVRLSLTVSKQVT